MNRHRFAAAAVAVLAIAVLDAAPAQSCSGARARRQGASNVIAIRNEAVELGASPLTIDLPIQSARAIPADAMVALTLDDVRAPQSPGIFYEVYLDLSPNGTRDASSPAYVGNLGFYGGASKQQFRVTEHVARALRAKQDRVRLTFVPRAMIDAEGRESIPAGTRVRIGRISITL